MLCLFEFIDKVNLSVQVVKEGCDKFYLRSLIFVIRLHLTFF